QDFRVEPGRKYALVAGNEVQGVDQKVVDLADTVIEIPQEGAKHSLNVSVSTGIALWHLFSALRGVHS
ncbi:MAG: TrmH family RNA methyltransferase, partial [Muribaculaceae bacterium]|nr:TrmH family RNA methyltransferase [Muribaculaceae bacterium]